MFEVQRKILGENTNRSKTNFSFRKINLQEISARNNGMIMSVLKSEDSTFCLVIAASTSAHDQKDHLKSFVEKNGAGVQHIAFHCDITTALESLKKTEIRIITPPKYTMDLH